MQFRTKAAWIVTGAATALMSVAPASAGDKTTTGAKTLRHPIKTGRSVATTPTRSFAAKRPATGRALPIRIDDYSTASAGAYAPYYGAAVDPSYGSYVVGSYPQVVQPYSAVQPYTYAVQPIAVQPAAVAVQPDYNQPVQYVGVQTGRSVAISVPGNMCTTPVKTCVLEEASYVGNGCTCNVAGGRSAGSVTP